MQRNYQIHDFAPRNCQELHKRLAYHRSGHATAIYLYNKQKQLPPIYFQITLKNNPPRSKEISPGYHNLVNVEGGCLIQNLAASFIDYENYMSADEKAAYFTALEADTVNLLAGIVAEAHYVGSATQKITHAHLLNLQELDNYSSHADLKKITEYLSCIAKNPHQQKQKLAQLLSHSFEFIAQPKIWKAVKAVARFILTCKRKSISCEEVFAVIDASVVENKSSL